MSYIIDGDIIEFLDLINETLSISFVERWRHKYSEKFIKHFQFKVLDSMNKKKALKLEMLYNYFTKKCKYSDVQVSSFFTSIDIELYKPFIYGSYPKA